MVNQQQDDWDQYLDGVLFSIRMAPQSSTKYSPFHLLYGREPRIPSDLPSLPLEMDVAKQLPKDDDLDDFVLLSANMRQQTEEKAKGNLKIAQEKQKRDYSKRKSVGYHSFKVGDTVKLYNSKKKLKKGIVLEENYTGPYIIEKLDGKKCFLKNVASQKTLQQAHSLDNVKHFKYTEKAQICGYINSLSSTGMLTKVMDEAGSFQLIKVHTMTDFMAASADPVFSLVREVSKEEEAAMDTFTELLLPKLKKDRAFDTVKTSQQVDKLTVLSAILTFSYKHDLCPLETVDSLKGLPEFFQKQTPITANLQEGEHLLVCGEGIRNDDLETLTGNSWLNDKVVNAYLKLISREANNSNRLAIFVIPSYTATLWDSGSYESHLFRKVKFSNYKYVFVPWNVRGNHWVLLVADVMNRSVGVLDSLQDNADSLLDKFCQFMMIRGSVAEPELADCWVRTSFVCNKQSDGNSCGVFVLMNAECLSAGKSCILVTQNHVSSFRELAKTRLLKAGVKVNANICDAFTCQKPRGPARWYHCDVCHRWWHRKCMDVPFFGDEFVCVICKAQYT